MELDLGEMEGVTGQEMREGWPLVYQTWRENPSEVVMPGGESLVELQQRAWRAFKKAEQAHHDGDVVVVVSHNFAIRAIFASLLKMPLSNFHSMYLSLSSICTVERGQWGLRLLSYNSVCHLSADNR